MDGLEFVGWLGDRWCAWDGVGESRLLSVWG